MAGDGQERPGFAGDGGGDSASRERVGCEPERKRESDVVWFDQTGSGQVDPVGSDLWAQGPGSPPFSAKGSIPSYLVGNFNHFNYCYL